MNPAEHSARPIAQKIEHVFDGAQAVVTDEGLMAVAVWKGGRTINIYDLETLQQRTCFTISDDKGRALEREAIVEHIEDMFEQEKEDLFGEYEE